MDNFLNLQNFQPPDNLDFPIFEDFNFTAPQSENKQYHEEFIQDGKKTHRCTFPNCGKVFKFKSEITRHVIIHFTDRPHVCPYENCKKNFKRADALDNHVRIHTNDLPFACDYPECNLRFITKAALRYHLLKHNNERAYTCSFPGCEKSFLTRTQLKQHERAENYHQKIAAINSFSAAEPKEDVKKMKTEVVISKDICANIGPAPRMAKSLAWETKNPDEVDEVPEVKVDGNLESMLKQMLEENRKLKEKLEVCTKIMDVFHENKEMKMRLPKSPEEKSPFDFSFNFGEQREPNFSMSGSEFSFLNF